ncbi:MAG TPA: DNA-3-methyladenine glycosylase [Candidatus Saccharimonadales bacterium]|nr:DNA-3-methyladenine glycosylase [Candidatus Saccharimonadales bacterium]
MSFEDKLRQAEKYLARRDKKLAPVIMASGPCRIAPHRDHYGELVGSIVGQQLSAKAGAVIWQRVLDLFGGKMPSPQKLIEMDADKIRAAGVSRPKIAYMKDLAQHIIDKRLDLDHIATMPNDQLIEQLTAVKGIGAWSAHMFMLFGLGRLDILPVGDLGIRKAISSLYGFKDLPTPEQIITVASANSWHPYESVASWYLWQSLDNSPAKKTRHNV